MDTIRSMAAEPDDVFVRHRGAVLEALLSASTLDNDAKPTPLVPPDPAAPAPTPDTSPDAPDNPRTAPVPGTKPDTPDSGRIERSHASDLINALLAGRSEETTSGASFMNNALPRTEPGTEGADRPAESESAPDRARVGARLRLAGVPERVQVLLRTPRARPILLIAAAVIVALVIALIARPAPESRTDPIATKSVPAAAPASPTPSVSSAPQLGSQIHVRAVESKCPKGSTPGMDAFEGTPGKAWSCVRAFQLDGQLLKIDLGGTFQVDSIAIVPGWDQIAADGTDQWTRYRTASRVSYRFNDADTTTYTQDTLDQRGQVVTRFDPPVRASRVYLTVLRSSGSPSANTTAISSIVITGTPGR